MEQPKSSRLPFLQALALKQKGLSHRQIATQLAVSPSTVDQAFAKHADLLTSPDALKIYESGRAQLFSALESKLLTSALHHDVNNTSLRDKMIALGVIYDKRRLETGASTANVGVVAQIVAASDRALFGGAKRAQQLVRDTPTTPKGRGTGGKRRRQAAVVTRDPHVGQNEQIQRVTQTVEGE